MCFNIYSQQQCMKLSSVILDILAIFFSYYYIYYVLYQNNVFDIHFGANYKNYFRLPAVVQITYLYFVANYEIRTLPVH